MIPNYRNTSLNPIVQEIGGVTYTEEWCPVAEYEGLYEISSFGRLKRLERRLKNGGVKPDRIILPSRGKAKGGKLGYFKFGSLKSKNRSIHRLVATAFIPAVSGKDHVNHITGKKEDNHFSQLEWCTPQENNEHGVKLGLLKRGRNIKPYVKKRRVSRFKKIINIKTRQVYESINEVVNVEGYSIRYFGKQLRGDRVNHTPYRYLGSDEKFIRKPGKGKRVHPISIFDMNWNHLKRFDFPIDAAAFIGVKNSSCIYEFLKGKRTHVKGYKFKKVNASGEMVEPAPFISKKKPLKPKRIRNAPTPAKEIVKLSLEGEQLQLFKSLRDAARHCGSDRPNLRKIIQGKRKGRIGYYKGFIYKYT